MSWRRLRLTDLFALFFDPKVPTLFIVGSIVLAVVGNGIYDLLLYWFGETASTITAIVVSATLIFVALTLGFWALIRRYRPDDATLVPPEQEAQPHAGLILTVGPNPNAAARAIIEWHLKDVTLRHCWLLVTPLVAESQHYKDLRFWLMEQNVVPHILTIADPEQVDASYAAVRQGISQADKLVGAASVIVDITGGLKPMTAGMVLACREAGIPMQYLKSRRDELGQPLPNSARPMMVEIQRMYQVKPYDSTAELRPSAHAGTSGAGDDPIGSRTDRSDHHHPG